MCEPTKLWHPPTGAQAPQEPLPNRSLRLRDQVYSHSGRRKVMTGISARRLTVDVEGDFIVFLIGMRINKPWKVHKWLPRSFSRCHAC